ncbi:MAG: DUF4835 family protein [Prevotellaceae bacterium]|jgi:hypothetical protein|nr:DUF4835 family protein [Prevotellaceae bacterium]
MLATFGQLKAQTVSCNVILNSQKIQSTNSSLFQEMKSSITDFVNTRTWSDLYLQPHERIECNIIITLNEMANEKDFKGTIQVQALRPVYGSTYKSTTLNVLDNDFEFRFVANEVLDYSEMSHLSDLTSMLAFWVHIILGLDFDTFSERGGTDYYTRAERIVQRAQNESKPGWTQNSGSAPKNRYWMVADMLSPKYARERQALYLYHRKGLDLMSTNAVEGRKGVMSALKDMQTLYKEAPDNTMFYNVFFDTKADEIVNIFADATPAEKEEAYAILSTINVTNDIKYQKLK